MKPTVKIKLKPELNGWAYEFIDAYGKTWGYGWTAGTKREGKQEAKAHAEELGLRVVKG